MHTRPGVGKFDAYAVAIEDVAHEWENDDDHCQGQQVKAKETRFVKR